MEMEMEMGRWRWRPRWRLRDGDGDGDGDGEMEMEMEMDLMDVTDTHSQQSACDSPDTKQDRNELSLRCVRQMLVSSLY